MRRQAQRSSFFGRLWAQVVAVPLLAGVLSAGPAWDIVPFAVRDAHAQETDRQFDLDNVKRMMEEIKRKADAARLGNGDGSTPKERNEQPAPSASAPTDREIGKTRSAKEPTGKPVQEINQARTSGDDREDATPTVSDADVLRNQDGREVDPAQAAAREEEADEVLKAIRRARAARDAWLNDDPKPVLDGLPKTPPARRFPKPSLADPRIEPAPSETARRDGGLSENAFVENVRRSLGGPNERELLPIDDDGGDGSASSVYERSDESVTGPSADPLRKLRKPTRRVTVLLVMDVGKTGVRRWSKTADPMLCLHEYCFLSRGPSKSAVRHKRRVAFGPSVALGKRGLACRSSPACIFRNVDLGALEARLQPVDLRFLRHDRREAELVRADISCKMVGPTLTCGQPIEGKSWRAWLVPELVAELAGEAALKKALVEGLGGRQPVATSEKKRFRNR